MKKRVVFYFNSFGPWLEFGFCGLILSFAAFRECKSFFLFLKQQVSRNFIELLLVTPTLACSHTCDFTTFLVFLKNDFSWNWAIRIGWEVSAFRCWQFSPSSFFAQKNTTRKLIFCVSPLPIWIPLKRQSIFKFFVIPGSLLRPPDVRIWNETTLKSACCWNAQKLLEK